VDRNSGTTVIPSSTSISGNASISYQLRFGTAGASYYHGTMGGGGFFIGAKSDSLSANLSRQIDRKTTVGLTFSYMRTAGLSNNGVTNAAFGGIQASRPIGRHLNVFANYTAIDQSSGSELSTNVLSGLQNVIGFGFGYSPRKTELKR
jgi:hypothetical protein